MAGSPGYVGKPRYLVYLDDTNDAKVVGVNNPLPVIGSGIVPAANRVNKFGRNQTISSSGTREDIWDGSSLYTWSTTNDITHVVSGNAGDTFDIEVLGLDTNYALVTQTATLNGTTAVALGTPLLRVFRMKNTSATAALGNIDCGVGAATPFAAANLRARITLGFEQTLMAIYTVPAGYTAYITSWRANLLRKNAASVDMTLWARSQGGVFRVQDTDGVISSGSSSWRIPYDPWPEYAEKTDLIISALSDTNNVDVGAGFDLRLVANA